MIRPRPPSLRDDITHVQIERLVRDFYVRIRADERLGPIFEAKLHGQWEPHLLRMIDFVSGMTDSYAVSLYKKVRGISLPGQ